MKFIETKDIKTIYNDMLKQFPKEELKSCEHLENLLGKNYKAYLVIDNEPVGYVLLFRSAVFYTLLLRGIRSAAGEIPSGDDPKPADAGSEK